MFDFVEGVLLFLYSLLFEFTKCSVDYDKERQKKNFIIVVTDEQSSTGSRFM